MAEALTKKQQKAQAFRSKQKAKKSGKNEEPQQDVPEQDLVDDNEENEESAKDAGGAAVKAKDIAGEASTKRKSDAGADVVKELKKGGKDVKGKGKAQNEWAEGEEGEGEGVAEKKKSKKEIKQRFILFVGEWGKIVLAEMLIAGNLGFKTTREEVQAHFTEAAGKCLVPCRSWM